MAFKLFNKQPYKEIKDMVRSYSSVMQSISSALRSNPVGPQLDITNEPIGFYITPEELGGITKTISGLENFNKYLALFGIEKDTDNLTICIVGADANGKILDKYKEDENTFGEEKWGLKSFITLSNTPTELNDFLNKK